MAEVRVQLPLSAFSQDVGKFGNPRASGARDHWFKSSRPDLVVRWEQKTVCSRYSGGSRAGTGVRLLTATSQVRFLSPELKAESEEQRAENGEPEDLII